MQLKFPEKNKKAGLCYAVTDDGLELPVIDITHPAFEVSVDERQLDAQLQQFLHDSHGPAFLRGLLFALMRRRSILMRGLIDADGTFLSGLNTYILKLGADNLNKSYFGEIDRRIAGSPAGLFARLRLQDISHLLADNVASPLSANKKARLHLLNIGGGPAIDSINALIVLQKEHPDLLNGRQIFIHSLDPDNTGPTFGAGALTALQAESGPLHGLDIDFDHRNYNWSNPELLREHLRSLDGQSICAVSSEGALFEVTPNDTSVAGSVTRADQLGRMANRGSGAALQFRGLEAFSALALRAGWKVEKTMDRPLSHDVLMKKV